MKQSHSRFCRWLSLVAGLTAVATANAGYAAAANTACPANLDFGSATPAQLAACQLQRVPLSSTESLPYGGTKYNYQMPDGQVYSTVQPPLGLTPADLTPSQDAAYGLPASLADSSAWNAANVSFARVQAEPYLIAAANADSPDGAPTLNSISPFNTIGSQNYAGYSETGSGWTESEVTYTEPHLGSTSCSNPGVSFWAGIGGANGATDDKLGQAGTWSGNGAPGGAVHQIFLDNLPASAVFPGATAPAGSSVSVYVYYNGSNNWSYVVLVNSNEYIYTGTGSYDGNSAYAIIERPTVGGLVNFLNFGSITMHGEEGRGLSNLVPSTTYTMPYATTGSISGGQFGSSYVKCS